MQRFSLNTNWIPEQPWEAQLVEALSISLDQIRFTLAFALAVGAGFAIRWVRNPTARNLFSFVAGFLCCYYPFGNHVLHGVITSLVSYLVMWLVPRKAGTLVWLIAFPYLTVLHVVNASGLSWASGDLDFTGGQMVLTLKLISMAVCFQDAHDKDPDNLTPYQKDHVFRRLPGLLEFMGFVFAFGNLLAGPILEFRDYQMWVHSEGPWDKKAARKIPLSGDLSAAAKAYVTAMLALAFYITMEPTWNFKLTVSPWYLSQPLFIRLVTIQLIGTTYRTRYYFAWALGHCSLAAAGLDFKGWDPSSGKGTWGRVKNAYPLKVEFCDSSRLLGQYWNSTTGNFLRRYVYERLAAPPPKKPGFRELMVTQLVSGVWHGLYPGYIMFFAGSAVFFAHSTVIWAFERAYLPPALTKSWPWWALKVFMTKQGLDFLATAFLWLTWNECLAAWASVHYLPLAFMVAVQVLGSIFPIRVPKGDKAGGASKASSGAAAASAAAAAADGGASAGQCAAGGQDEEPVASDHLHLGEGVKSSLIDSGSRPDLLSNGLKEA